MRTALGYCPEPRPELPAVLGGRPRDAFRLAADLGLDGVELYLRAPDEIPRAVLAALLREHGLAAAAVHTGRASTEEGLHLSHTSPELRQAALQRLLAQADLAGDLGAPVVVGLIRGRRPSDRSAADQWRLLAPALGRCARHAQSRGIRLLIEPLPAPIVDTLHTLEEVRACVTELGSGGAGVMLDGMAAALEGLALPAAIRHAGDLLGGVQVSEPGRGLPVLGPGEVAAIAQGCRDVAFDGYLSIECVPGPDPLDTARRAAQLAASIAQA